jgi:hypothetical protein
VTRTRVGGAAQQRPRPGVLAGSVAAVGTAAAAIALSPRLPPGPDSALEVALIGVAWAAFAVGAWLVMRLPVRAAVLLILAGGLAVQLSAGFGEPRSSDDLFRYIWDGRVQAAGIDPYRYAPAAAELVGLRDEFLWPQRAAWCVPPGAVDPDTGDALVPGCTRINRPDVHTIYPPVAEAIVFVVHGLSPPDGGHVRGYVPIQVAASAFALATTVLLLVGLRRRDPRRAVLWAWCPMIAIETASNAHIDVAAAFLTGLALLVLATASSRPRAALGGVLLGLAIATKLTPALVTPSVLRRRPLTLMAAAVGAVAAVYLPHVLTVGAAVLGYLPGYLREEGYTSGSRFALLTWVLPEPWAPPVAVAVLTIVGMLVLRAADPDRPWDGAVVMVGTALLVTTPSYPWYGLLLALLVALGGRVEWLAVAAAGYLAQYPHEVGLTPPAAQRIGYGLALLIVVLGVSIRARTSSRIRATMSANGHVGPSHTARGQSVLSQTNQRWFVHVPILGAVPDRDPRRRVADIPRGREHKDIRDR